jgi:hypothetical protein
MSRVYETMESTWKTLKQSPPAVGSTLEGGSDQALFSNGDVAGFICIRTTSIKEDDHVWHWILQWTQDTAGELVGKISVALNYMAPVMGEYELSQSTTYHFTMEEYLEFVKQYEV